MNRDKFFNEALRFGKQVNGPGTIWRWTGTLPRFLYICHLELVDDKVFFFFFKDICTASSSP